MTIDLTKLTDPGRTMKSDAKKGCGPGQRDTVRFFMTRPGSGGVAVLKAEQFQIAVNKRAKAMTDEGQGIGEIRLIGLAEAAVLAQESYIAWPRLCLLCGDGLTDQKPPIRFAVLTASVPDPNNLIISGICLGCLTAGVDLRQRIYDRFRRDMFDELRPLGHVHRPGHS
jgi:hypothetical protein